MSIDLSWADSAIRQAVQRFWKDRDAKGVRSGGHLKGFDDLIQRALAAGGLQGVELHKGRTASVLPGHFRPTKEWDVVATHRGRLIAAVELKSQVESFGKNLNNRTEEALGSAVDLGHAVSKADWAGFYKPFVGYIMLLSDDPAVLAVNRLPKTVEVDGFAVDSVFHGSTYRERYIELCRRMVEAGLYTHAAIITSAPNTAAYFEPDPRVGVRQFLQSLAAHAVAMRPV